MKIERTPLFFGSDERSLFGWLHIAPDVPRRHLAVVVCPPLGHEYVNSHRPMRHLTDALAAAGIAALRFDYHGTGDSSGADEEPARIAAWTASIREAMATLRKLTHCDGIGLVGVRFGATLAVLVAQDVEVAALALWAPALRGRAYNRELKALYLTGAGRDAPADATGAIEPGGFVVTEETQRDIAAIELEVASSKAKRTLIVARDADVDAMFLPPHSAVVPHGAIANIVAWIADGTTALAAGPLPAVRQAQRVGDVREAIVRFDSLFGILSEPADGAAHGPVVLLSNAGSAHHAGPNRLYVLLARALSRAGFRCLRFDFPGLGDSFVDGVEQENEPYPDDASAIVARAIEAVNAPVVLMGLCAGAHASFHAAVDLHAQPIVESVLINPLTFHYQRGMPLDQPNTNSEWQRYMKSVRSVERWRKLLRGRARVGGIVRTVFRRFRDIAARMLTLRLHDLERDVRRIVESGRKLTFVFSRFDPGYDLLMIDAGRAVKRLQRSGNVTLWRIDGANHTFELRRSREVMIASVVRHLTQRYPRSRVSS